VGLEQVDNPEKANDPMTIYGKVNVLLLFKSGNRDYTYLIFPGKVAIYAEAVYMTTGGKKKMWDFTQRRPN
jgi:hypothetical protein